MTLAIKANKRRGFIPTEKHTVIHTNISKRSAILGIIGKINMSGSAAGTATASSSMDASKSISTKDSKLVAITMANVCIAANIRFNTLDDGDNGTCSITILIVIIRIVHYCRRTATTCGKCKTTDNR
jgi:hypothetical protein